MRTREDLEARDNRRMTKETNAGMTTGNEIYNTCFFFLKKKTIQSLKNMEVLQIAYQVQWEL